MSFSNANNERGFLVVFIAMVIFVILMFLVVSFVYYIDDNFDRDCLKKIAKDYCEENKMKYQGMRSGNIGFGCAESLRQPKTQYFNFLEEEIKSCVIKEHFSWRKLK